MQALKHAGSDGLVEKLIGDAQPGDFSLLWSGYQPPPEASGWLSAFVSMTASWPSPITLSDVTHALGSIPRDAWQRGRSYYWEGVVLSPDRKSAHIRWGS